MKLVRIITVILSLTGVGLSQSYTSITATLQDNQGQVWANASVSASIVPPFGNSNPLNNNGVAPISPIQVFADGTGSFGMNLDDNLVTQPSGSTWRFTICPNATVANCSTSIQVVHGGSMNLGASLSNDLVPISVAAAPTIKRAYVDNEVTGGQGAIYWRTSDNTLRGYNGSSWNSIGGGGGGSSSWSALTSPTNNMVLGLNNFTTLFNEGTTGNTGTNWLITDSNTNTGTNYLFQVATGTSSTAKPASFCVQGTNNCIEFNANATLQALGSAIITATQVINTGPGVGAVQLGSNGAGSISVANTIKLTGNNNAAFISENAGPLSKVLLGGQAGCATNNLWQSADVNGNNTCISYGAISAGPLYGTTGSQFNTLANPAHWVKGQQALVAGTTTVTFSGNAVYTSNLTYYCFGNDANNINAVQAAPLSGTQVAFNGNGTDLITFVCYGQ